MITKDIHPGHVRSAVERDLEWISEHEDELRKQFEGREPESIWLMVNWALEAARQAISNQSGLNNIEARDAKRRLNNPESKRSLQKLRVTLMVVAAWARHQEAE